MKTHPGSVIHLSDNPLDSSKVSTNSSQSMYIFITMCFTIEKVLIGYELGLITLWDMRGKCAELRFVEDV